MIGRRHSLSARRRRQEGSDGGPWAAATGGGRRRAQQLSLARAAAHLRCGLLLQVVHDVLGQRAHDGRRQAVLLAEGGRHILRLVAPPEHDRVRLPLADVDGGDQDHRPVLVRALCARSRAKRERVRPGARMASGASACQAGAGASAAAIRRGGHPGMRTPHGSRRQPRRQAGLDPCRKIASRRAAPGP
jgi:hypothetical protein